MSWVLRLSVSLWVLALGACGGAAARSNTKPAPPAVAAPAPAPAARPKVLYIDTTQPQMFAELLGTQGFDVDARDPSRMPGSLDELSAYAFVVLSDVPGQLVPLPLQEAVARYVAQGGGLLFSAGESRYAGWSHTPVGQILPVDVDAMPAGGVPPGAPDAEKVALALVIDRSGSMTGLPIEMAKQAAKASVDVLDGEDLVEVIVFDAAPVRVVPLMPAGDHAGIEAAISRIQPGGGTDFFPALDAAQKDLRAAAAPKKHVILLTDGQAPAEHLRDLVVSMAANGITVTAVGLGAGVDAGMLKMLSDAGNGRFYEVHDPEQLPKIFRAETELVSRRDDAGYFTLVHAHAPADFLRGIDLEGAPFLHAYVSTRMKPPPAEEILVSDSNEPILARLRVSKGWTIAWTSDVKNAWSADWFRWPHFTRLWGQLVREHMASEGVRPQLR
jgi:uncharacterized membrane protein